MTGSGNIWLDGVMGVVTGDALGCPVQFKSRQEVARHPVRGMRGYGTFHLPEGTWTDDSSLTLALLDSIRRVKGIDPDDIMRNFLSWLNDGSFTPYGRSFDIGRGTREAILRYSLYRKADACGGRDERSNGNGSLMRILPACLYCHVMEEKGALSEEAAVRTIHEVGSLTHAHIRANLACGLYYFMVRQVLKGTGPLTQRLQEGLSRGFSYYESCLTSTEELAFYDRLRDLAAFSALPADKIRSTGYVVDALEAAIWSLTTTESFDSALLKAVNLGDDTDTVAAIAGGLAGLWYGYGAIPGDWLSCIRRREWIEGMCGDVL